MNMFRNYLTAALRNMARNRLYAAISVIGLAVGMAASLLAGLYIRDELTFDHIVPGYENVYVIGTEVDMPGSGKHAVDATLPQVAGWLKTELPNLTVARLTYFRRPIDVRQGTFHTFEDVVWVDSEFFSVLPYPALAGDLKASVNRPDSIVITRGAARSYFGIDDPVGRTLTIAGHPMTVTAVLQDLPANSHLANRRLFASGSSSYSWTKYLDAKVYDPNQDMNINADVYVRLSGVEAAALPSVLDRIEARNSNKTRPGGLTLNFFPVPLDRLHLYPFMNAQSQGGTTLLWAFGGIGLLILAAAAINFVNLMTARAARRAMEIGVRKTAGAARRDLFMQFMGEAILYSLLATAFALALIEAILPTANALLLKEMRFYYWADPALLAAILLQTLALALLAGLYPSLLLSRLKPAHALKPAAHAGGSSALVRQMLALVQFAVLVGLVLASLVILRQTNFILSEGTRLDRDMVLTVNLGGQAKDKRSACTQNPFVEQVRRLSGVSKAACSSSTALGYNQGTAIIAMPGGGQQSASISITDFDFFSLYGIKPLAGRLFSASRPGDAVPDGGDPEKLSYPLPIVVNESFARATAGSPAGAIGKLVTLRNEQRSRAVIIGVVPDFGVDVRQTGQHGPAMYVAMPYALDYLSIKLNGRDIPETLAAIDGLWKSTGQSGAIKRQFLDDFMRDLYSSTIRQGWLMVTLTVIAIVISYLGLFGLAAFTAEQRTKEIGIRKAMGASTPNILRLLLWQFGKPVLLANLIAWPIAWYFMDQWLNGFSAHIVLSLWMFAAAGGAALFVALLTVLGHTLLVARRKPVAALRYE
jgi:putative ABC transport system permease protein